MTDDLAWTLGCVIALAGIGLGLWALFADRSRGRARCPRCWYDLSASVEAKPALCPECGRSVRKPYKTRRRWRWAACGFLVVCAGLAWPISRQVSREGWLSVVPTPILLEMYLGDWGRSSQAVESELSYHRVAQGKYWRAYRGWVISRCLRELNDASAVDRDNAASLLAWIGERDRRVTPALLRLLKDSDPVVRQRAVRSLGIYRAEPAVAIGALLAVLEDPLETSDTRAEAASVIGQYGEAAAGAVPALAKALDDPDPLVRGGAAEALGWIGLERPAMALRLVTMLRSAQTEEEMLGILLGLGLLGKDAAPAAGTIGVYLRSGSGNISDEAMRTLMRIGAADSATVAQLRAIRDANQPTDYRMRSAAVALRVIDGEAASTVEALAAELSSEDRLDRVHAVSELARLRWRAEPALAALATAQDDSDSIVSWRSATVISQFRGDIAGAARALRARKTEVADYSLGTLARLQGVWPGSLPR